MPFGAATTVFTSVRGECSFEEAPRSKRRDELIKNDDLQAGELCIGTGDQHVNVTVAFSTAAIGAADGGSKVRVNCLERVADDCSVLVNLAARNAAVEIVVVRDAHLLCRSERNVVSF